MKPPSGEVYQCIESPRGELCCYIVSDGSVSRPGSSGGHPRRKPGVSWQMTRGYFFADLIAILSSIDIVLAEVDR